MKGSLRAAIAGLALMGAFFAGWTLASDLAKPAPALDVAGEVERAFRAGSRLDRAARLIPALESLTPENLDSVRQVYEMNLSTLGECDIRPFVDAWTAIDPQQAFESTMDWRLPTKWRIGVEAAAHGWAVRNPREALPVVEQTAQMRPRLAKELRISLVSGWLHSGQEGLDTYLAEGPGRSPALLTTAIAARLKKYGLNNLLAWSQEFFESADPELRLQTFRKTVQAAGRQHPRQTASWVMEHSNEDYGADGPRVLAEVWADTAPLDAFEWIRLEAPEESRSQAVGLTFGRWLHMDRAAAVAWLEASNRTTFHDPAIQTFARQLVRRSAEEAILWCERVQGSQQRMRCLTNTAKSWYRRAPEAAEAWLGQSTLDSAARKSVRSVKTHKTQQSSTDKEPERGQ